MPFDPSEKYDSILCLPPLLNAIAPKVLSPLSAKHLGATGFSLGFRKWCDISDPRCRLLLIHLALAGMLNRVTADSGWTSMSVFYQKLYL